MNYYVLGTIVGAAFAIIIALLIWKATPNSEFDERQLYLRGKAFQHAFFSVLIISGLYSIIVLSVGHPLMEDGVSTMLAALFGVMVFAVECIMRDAYFSVIYTPISNIIYHFRNHSRSYHRHIQYQQNHGRRNCAERTSHLSLPYPCRHSFVLCYFNRDSAEAVRAEG